MPTQVRITFAGEQGEWIHQRTRLLQHLLPDEFEFVVVEKQADFVVVAPSPLSQRDFYKNHLQVPIRIFWGGEALYPDFNIFDYALGFANLTMGDRYAQVHPLTYFHRYLSYGSLDNSTCDLSEICRTKTRFCDFIYSNHQAHPYRDALFHFLNDRRGVHSFGHHLNNAGDEFHRVSWDDDWRRQKILCQQSSQFSLCIENTLFTGYTSEKILTAMLAHAVPIYWGNPEIGRYFNPESFINCHDYSSFEEIDAALQELIEDPARYEGLLSQPWMLDEHEQTYQEMRRNLADFFSNIFTSDIKEPRRPVGVWPSACENQQKKLWSANAIIWRQTLNKGLRKAKALQKRFTTGRK